jgi:hypothetical protein
VPFYREDSFPLPDSILTLAKTLNSESLEIFLPWKRTPEGGPESVHAWNRNPKSGIQIHPM